MKPLKVWINQEINPFQGEELQWSVRVPDWIWKFYHRDLSKVLDKLGEEILKKET